MIVFLWRAPCLTKSSDPQEKYFLMKGRKALTQKAQKHFVGISMGAADY